MTLVNPLPFAQLVAIGFRPHIAACRLSGHTAAASSVGWPVPSAWHGTALHSRRSGRHQCACGKGACRQADDHRFGQHGCSAELSIVLENGPSFALVNRMRRLLHRRGSHRALAGLRLFRGGARPASGNEIDTRDEARRIARILPSCRSCCSTSSTAALGSPCMKTQLKRRNRG
jgi:hypothetical protein